jgi:hypothetical protein
MKMFTQFINETDNGADIKKNTKKNGFTIPATYKYNAYDKTYEYVSRQGFRGETAIRGVMDKLESAGWEIIDNRDSFVPDGSRVDYNTVMISPDKTVIFKSNCSYGGTSWNNYYKGVFKLVTDEEDELTLLALSEEFAKVFKEIGFRACLGGNGVGKDTIKQDSEGRPVAYFGMYLPSKSDFDVKTINRYKQNLESWKQIGEDEWEKGDFRVALVPEYEGSNFVRFAITYIGNVKRVKI